MPQDTQPPTYSLHGFGCKTNQYELDAIEGQLRALGWLPAPVGQAADWAIVNTCAVTAHAENNARRLALAKSQSGSRLCLTGCAASLGRPWTADLPAGTVVAPNHEKWRLARQLTQRSMPSASAPEADGGWPPPSESPSAESPLDANRANRAARANAAIGSASAESGESGETPLPDPRFRFEAAPSPRRARALVKIQDGCDRHCAYCAVPAARGAPASRPADEVLAESLRLAEAGRKEIALTGINIGAYRDMDGLRLDGLVRRLGRELGSRARIRLGSVEPESLTDGLLAAMAEAPGVMPHLHIAVQSGDDRVLRAMGRPGGAAHFLRWAARIQAALPRPALGVDMMVGFPGEDDDAFLRTMDLCAEANVTYGHVFCFSPRPGTRAARMARDAAAPPGAARERRDRLMDLLASQARRFAATWLGAEMRVAAERAAAILPPPRWNAPRGLERYSAITPRYTRVHFAARPGAWGEWVDIRIDRAADTHLWGSERGHSI